MDEYESALAVTRAWTRTNNARRAAQEWQRRAEAAQSELQANSARLAAADALVAAALALPDVVKTGELRKALSKYRKVSG